MRLNRLISKIKNKERVSFCTKDDLLQINPRYDSYQEIFGYEIINRITNKCNLNCEFCFVGPKDECVTDKRAEKLINIFKDMDLYNTRLVLSGGEPTIHPKYFEFLNKLKSTKAMVVTQTNATIFSKSEKLKKLHRNNTFFVSFPSSKDEEYNRITNSTQFQNFLNGAVNLSKNHYVELNHVLYEGTYRNFEHMLKLIKKRFVLENTFLTISNLSTLARFDYKNKLAKYTNLIGKVKGPFKEYKNLINIRFTMSGGCGFPFCVLKKITCIENRGHFKAKKEQISYGSLDRQFYKSKKCLSCRFDEFCQGFPKEYVQMFGDYEMDPVY